MLANPLKMVQLRAPKYILSLSAYLYMYKRGMNHLMIAAFKNDFAKVDKYLKNGYNINEQDKLGGTALMCVLTRSNPLDMVRHLLSKGANPNLLDNKGRNALLLAIFNDQNYETINELIEKGADVNIVDENKNTLLHYELSKSRPNLNIVNLLISSGVDVSAENVANDTAALLCVCNNINSEITLLILQASDPEATIDVFQTAGSKFIISVKNNMLNGFLVRYDYSYFDTESLQGYIIFENNQRVFARFYTHCDDKIENSLMAVYEHGKIICYGTGKDNMYDANEQNIQNLYAQQMFDDLTKLNNFEDGAWKQIDVEDFVKKMLENTK